MRLVAPIPYGAPLERNGLNVCVIEVSGELSIVKTSELLALAGAVPIKDAPVARRPLARMLATTTVPALLVLK